MKLRTTESRICYNTQKDERGYFNKMHVIDRELIFTRFYPKHYKGKLFKEIYVLENQIKPLP